MHAAIPDVILFLTPFMKGGWGDLFSRIYQYDPLGWVNSLGDNQTTGWFANLQFIISC
jgi:hypothetical protein